MATQEVKPNGPMENLVIVGGGTAGWMAAAAISKVFKDSPLNITVVESSKIGTVGVGEATIPEIVRFNQILGIDEKEFLKFTHGTFKLGIEFVNWTEIGHSYIHPFGRYGNPIDSIPFFHHWQKLFNHGRAKPLKEYCLAIQCCENNKFARPVNIPNSPLSEISYAFHFDAGLYAKFLRKYAEGWSVRCIDDTVSQVKKDASNGYIKELHLESGEVLSADFFIDCTGFKGLLIEQALHAGYDDWSHLLPANSAVTVATPKVDPLPPYTRATAHKAGWQWRIPLQHRTGNGHVYSDAFISDQEALDILMNNLEGEAQTEPKLIRFKTGKRRKLWSKNCLALGLSGGFLEPLESTSIHLIYEGIANFLGLFPNKIVDPVLSDKFNQLQDNTFTNVRDFLILHYWATKRDDSDFWRYCRELQIPDTLKNKIELYKNTGRVFRENNELFGEVSWIAVMQGQGITTNHYNPIADALPLDQLDKKVSEIYQIIKNSFDAMPQHEDYLKKYCG